MTHRAEPNGIIVPLSDAKRRGNRHTSSRKLSAIRNRLPFYGYRLGDRAGRRLCHWNVKPTWNYAEDFRTGRMYAEALMPLMEYVAGPASLPAIFRDMFEAVGHRRRVRHRRPDKFSGIEIGFATALGDLIASGVTATALASRRGNLDRVTSRDCRMASKIVMALVTGKRRRSEAMWDKEKALLAASAKAA